MMTIQLNLKERCEARQKERDAKIAKQEAERVAYELKRDREELKSLFDLFEFPYPEVEELDPRQDFMIDGVRFRMVPSPNGHYSRELGLVQTCQRCQEDIVVRTLSSWSADLVNAVLTYTPTTTEHYECPALGAPVRESIPMPRSTPMSRLCDALGDVLESEGFQRQQ